MSEGREPIYNPRAVDENRKITQTPKRLTLDEPRQRYVDRRARDHADDVDQAASGA